MPDESRVVESPSEPAGGSTASRYTPGPWAYDGVRVYAPALDRKVMVTLPSGEEVEHGEGLIALIYACQEDILSPIGSHDANAHLITAAPELLEAAKLARDAIGNTRDPFGLMLQAEKAYLALRAAIAKAEGTA
jgi:hypothetical protein